MRNIQLLNIKNEILYEAPHLCVREAVEVAANSGLCLDFINLDFQDLNGVNLDGISLNGASFFEANLCGANLSETHLQNCDFTNANLINACFCYADMINSKFQGCSFGATDIAETNLSGCAFSDWSSFTLAFGTAHRLHNCIFEVNKTICPISKPPLVIYGQNLALSVLDNHILRKKYKDMGAFTGMRETPPIDQNGPIHVFPLDMNQLMVEFIKGEICGR